MSDDEQLSERLRGQIDDAKRLVFAAESDLDEAVAQLDPVLVGDKRLSSGTLDRAFDKLKAARSMLAQLRQVLTDHEAAITRTKP